MGARVAGCLTDGDRTLFTTRITKHKDSDARTKDAMTIKWSTCCRSGAHYLMLPFKQVQISEVQQDYSSHSNLWCH